MDASRWPWPRDPAQYAPGQYVYFIGVPGTVKVGLTNELSRRYRNLQLGSPIPLTFYGAVTPWGDYSLGEAERAVHRRLADRRLHGEWFQLNEREILRELRRWSKQKYFLGHHQPGPCYWCARNCPSWPSINAHMRGCPSAPNKWGSARGQAA